MCHVSGVTCQVLLVMCPMLRVTYIDIIFFYKVVELVGGGSVINGAYPVWFSHKLHFQTLSQYFAQGQHWSVICFRRTLAAPFWYVSPQLRGARSAHEQTCKIFLEELPTIWNRDKMNWERKFVCLFSSLVEAPYFCGLLCWKQVARFSWSYGSYGNVKWNWFSSWKQRFFHLNSSVFGTPFMMAIQIIKKKEAWQIIEFGKPSEGLLPTRLPCLVSQQEAKRECFPFIISFKMALLFRYTVYSRHCLILPSLFVIF